MLYVSDKIKQMFMSASKQEIFQTMMTLTGQCFRHLEGRQTMSVMLNQQMYFIKKHTGIGWKEIIKNLLQLKLPVLSAKNEWRAIVKLQTLNISVPSVAAYGYQGLNPAKCESFILLEALTPSISLEDFCKNWKTVPPSFQLKRELISKVAHIARTLHKNGMNHRDFYLCHFLIDQRHSVSHSANDLNLFLIDLHRAQIRNKTPLRWIIKDLAGLYFSSKEIGLKKRDLFRFMKIYREKNLREILLMEQQCWEKVKTRGEKLYQEHAAA